MNEENKELNLQPNKKEHLRDIDTMGEEHISFVEDLRTGTSASADRLHNLEGHLLRFHGDVMGQMKDQFAPWKKVNGIQEARA